MTRPVRWFDRWQWTPGSQLCTCGHTLAEHPADRFRSCSRCVWCDDYREPVR